MICGAGESKSRLAKAAGGEPFGQTQKSCTPLWREAHFQVEMYKTHQNTLFSEHLWKLRCRKGARCCGAKHMSKSKVQKVEGYGTGPFLTFRCRFAWQAQGVVHLVKSEKIVRGFVSIFKNDGRCGTFEEDLQRCISRGRRITKDTWVRCVRRSRRRFPERGCILEHEILNFAWQVQHFVWPGITFAWQAQYFRQMEWKNRKTQWYEAVSSAPNVMFTSIASCNDF